jgi:AcrR family transcriptional regulator
MNFNTRCTIGRSWPESAHRGAGIRDGPAGALPQRKKNGAMKTASTRKRRPSAPPRRSGARSRPTRERILDAAERLFARRGFHGVSIRDITGAADVDVALANYHFGSKQGLLEAVFLRRAEDLNSERLARLDAAIAGARDQPPQLEAIIDAFTHPLLDRSARGSPGWKSYFALIAEINNSPEFGGVLMTKTFDPVVQRFIEAIRRALPGCDERDLYWAYHFLSGALTLTFAETGRIDKLSGGVCKASDLDSVHERLVPFCAAGFRALCARSVPRTKRPARRKAKR